MSRIERIFLDVKGTVSEKFPNFSEIELNIGCPIANKDHRKSSRQYMHVFCTDGCVCCANAASKLPEKNLYGLFFHEFGHLIAGPKGDECAADMAILKNFGIVINYCGKKELQEV